MSLVGLSERNHLGPPSGSGALGPGQYDYKLPQDIDPIKRRTRSERPLAFGSGAVKELNKLGASQYSPGPGFYNQLKGKSSFNREFMKSDADKDSYYLIQNGTLLRKLQQFSANRTLNNRPDITQLPQTVPGPGQYSPRQYQLTADAAQKKDRFALHRQSPQMSQREDTLNGLDLNRMTNMTKTSTLSEFISSRIEQEKKKTVGNNPPPKLVKNRPRAIPSIPSNSIAPPEDKTASNVVPFTSTVDNSSMVQQSNIATEEEGGPRKPDYLRAIEKANNLNVGPGSYDPIRKAKVQNNNTPDWSLQPRRFEAEKPPEQPDEMLYYQYMQKKNRNPVVPRSHSGNTSTIVQTQRGSKQLTSHQGSHGHQYQYHTENQPAQPSQNEFSLHQNNSAGEQSFEHQQKPEYSQAAALQAQVRVFQKHKHDATALSMSRSLSVSGKEGHNLSSPRADDDPNFDRDEAGIHNIMQGAGAHLQNSHHNMPDVHSPSRTLVKNMSDSLDKGSKPKLFKESTAKLYAQENFEQSLKSQRDDAKAFAARLKEGSPKKTLNLEHLMEMPDPETIDIKANLKEKFRSLTQAAQPKPGPGQYRIPGSIQPGQKPFRHQYFGSTSARFQGSLFHKGVGNGLQEIGPGTYQSPKEIKEREDSKQKSFVKNQEIIAFHKLRQLFPEKTSISTAQLNKIKHHETEHLGPGAYNKGGELQKRGFGSPIVAAFGTTDNRKLDNTSPGVIPNPGPGTYVVPEKIETSGEKKQSSVFASIIVRKDNLSGDPAMPCPTAYNLADYKSISKKPLQGGAPNNVLSLQKAERKKLIDSVFPFLVKNRMEDDSRTIEMSNLGPGSYSPQNTLFDKQQSNLTLRLKKNLSTTSRLMTSQYVDQDSKKVINLNSNQKDNCFGSSQARFDETERLMSKQPNKLGPGAYAKLNYEPKGKNFSTRFIGNSTVM